MASIRVYSETGERGSLAPVTGARQDTQTAGFGQAVGQGLQSAGQALGEYGQAVDAFNARVDEASVMEQDTALSEVLRPIEAGYLNTAGRQAMDGANPAREAWQKATEEARGRLVNDRQKLMFDTLARQRNARWAGQATTHLMQQTEAYTAGEENSHVAVLAREASMLPVGSEARGSAEAQLSMSINHIATRRGLGPEKREELAFETFSNVHVSTVQQLQNEQPDQAWDYLEAYKDEINPEVYARLMPQVRDDRNGYLAKAEVRQHLTANAPPVRVTNPNGSAEDVEVISPVPAGTRVSSGYGRRSRPIGSQGAGSANHGGIDYALPANSPVVAALPGTVRIRNDPDGYGTYVVVDHGEGRETVYAHLSSALVKDGDQVEQGATIALSGSSGNSTGPHLHFEYRVGGVKQNPAGVIGREAASLSTGQTRTPAPPQFTTVEDVYEFAAERAGGDWRLQEAMEREGLALLQQERSIRDDREDQGRRALDNWLTANPNATWDQIPSGLKAGVSPSYRLSVRNSTSPTAGDAASGDPAVGPQLYIDLSAEALATPRDFASRDLSALRPIIGNARYIELSKLQDRIKVGDTRTPDQTLSAVQPIFEQYVTETFGKKPTSGYSGPQLERQAEVRERLMGWVESETAAGRPPDNRAVAGQMRVLLAPVAGADNVAVPFASARNSQAGFVIPRAERSQIVRSLTRSLGRAPSAPEISREWARLLRSGEVALPSDRF